MKVFIDTNVLIDFIARRELFYQDAASLINLGIRGEIELYATPLTYATCVFVSQKVLGYDGVIKALQILESYISIVEMNATQCHHALFSNMPDYEDMLQFEAAYEAGCDLIITRNKKHFPSEGLQVLEPAEFFNKYWTID
jgi:predicted nucleic acid-binding protein